MTVSFLPRLAVRHVTYIYIFFVYTKPLYLRRYIFWITIYSSCVQAAAYYRKAKDYSVLHGIKSLGCFMAPPSSLPWPPLLILLRVSTHLPSLSLSFGQLRVHVFLFLFPPPARYPFAMVRDASRNWVKIKLWGVWSERERERDKEGRGKGL